MNFELDESQRLLKDSVDRLLGSVQGGSRRAGGRAGWRELAAAGLLGLPFTEEDGGFGAGPVETMIVMEAIGRSLAPDPYLPSVVLCGGLLRGAASAAVRARTIPGLAAGETVLAFAHQEPQGRYDLADVETRARRTAEGWLIDGRKGPVAGADEADALLVVARTAGERFERRGLSVFLVDGGAAGLRRHAYTAYDGTRGAALDLAGVAVGEGDLVGEVDLAFDAVEHAVDGAIAAGLSEAVGIMDAVIPITVSYLKTRSQFGRPIGEFQALQHRAVDMLVAAEQARSMAIFAAANAKSTDAPSRRRAISGAKVQVARALRFVTQQAVQLHGGIGVTEEAAVGPYLKRATAIEAMHGDLDHHLALFAATGGFVRVPERAPEAA